MAENTRWGQEAEFFDNEEYNEGPIPANTIERYRRCLHPFTPAESPFASLGDVTGRTIFELGSGDGSSAILLALKGAQVVGVDISMRAVEIARKRAALHGVSERASFHCMPVEQYLQTCGSQKFDIICGFAILHHLLPVLDDVISQVKRLGQPETTYLFVEPLATSAWLRRLRLLLPLKVHATPDERPLNSEDLATLRRHFPHLRIHTSGFLSRPWHRFVGGRVEDYSTLKRALYHSLCRLDLGVLSVPGTLGFASQGILIQAGKD